ncbi:protease [Cutibacterium acnes JCM 18916]|nr:protease [Cutibacterium acnes JCM 18916]
MRYPDVHGDLVVFTADDDVWLVPVTGGRASRLTNDHVMVRNPRFSPMAPRLHGRPTWVSGPKYSSSTWLPEISAG